VKAYRKLDAFDATRPMIAWLLTIARRTALNHFRDARAWEPLPDEAAPAQEEPPDAAAERSEATADLWERAKERLSPREYSALWLRFGEDFSVRETARVLGLTETHVKILVFRAKRALMKGLKP
jgi:RNA polymerase sigma-70 factor (ECF subfamily)